MVPEGWIHTTFGRHIECLTGFAFKSNGYSNAGDDIRLLRGDNIIPGGLRWRDAKLWPKNETDGLEGYQLQDGDFVIALDRTWISSGLKVAEVTTADLPCLLVQRVARIRAKDSLEQSLLRQYFSGHRFEQYVKSVQTATAVPHISPNDIKEFTVPLPPLPEQKKIAQILSTWDQAITATERLLENSQQRKKGLMQQLLTGKKRLPGFEGEWEEVKVGTVLSVRKDKQIPSEDAPLYSLTIESGITEKTDRYNREFLVKDAKEKQYKKVLPKDIVYNPANLRWGAINYSRLSHTVVVSPIYEVLYVTEPEKHCLEFLAQSLMRPDQINRFASMVEGTLMERMAVKIGPFLATRLRVPPSVAEEQAIATILSAADSEIIALNKRLRGLEQEKKALMQQLLTGKRRVQVDTEAA